MIPAMYTAETGLNACNNEMSVIGDNIANSNTTAFKSSSLNFENLILQQNGEGYSGREIGGGVIEAGMQYDWTQGTAQQTSNPYSMAITGNGFFELNDPNVPTGATTSTYYTRDGDFTFQTATNAIADVPAGSCSLQTSTGMLVQGFACTSAPGVSPPTFATTASSIQYDPTQYQNITQDQNGIYWGVNISTGSKDALYQVGICDTQGQTGMAKASGNLYIDTSSATAALSLNTPGTNNMGSVAPGYTEMSNVNLANEMVNLIVAQRSFTANAKVITTSDQVMQDLVNVKQ